jgi:hypothetical protein
MISLVIIPIAFLAFTSSYWICVIANARDDVDLRKCTLIPG